MLSLNNEVDTLIKRKMSICDCNPCDCSDKEKEIFFKELKEVLDSYNRKYAPYLPKNIKTVNDSHVSGSSSVH